MMKKTNKVQKIISNKSKHTVFTKKHYILSCTSHNQAPNHFKSFHSIKAGSPIYV